MTKLADLARSLGGIELSTAPDKTTRYHTILLKYPVLELLPVGVAQPHLEPPALLQRRVAPPKESDMAGIHDTTFFARLEIQPRNPFALTPVKDSHAGLLAAIDAASTMVGTTTLEMVSYFAPNGGHRVHRIRLVSRLQAATTTPQDFELTDQELNELLKHKYRAWIRLLNSIVRRISARAYYHVRERLVEACGEKVAASEEAAWIGLWQTRPPRSIQTLLRARLCPEQSGFESNLGDGTGSVLITPPCGHQSMLRKISLVALTAKGCRTFECPACGERVLQPEDDNELGLRNVCLRAQAFVENYSAWTDLDEGITVEQQQIKLPALAVMCAISGALASMKLPILISPPELSFIGLRETSLVFAEIEETFGEGQWTVTGTPKEIFDGLVGLARNAIPKHLDVEPTSEDALPPGWTQNMERWFHRACFLVGERGCEMDDPQHAGLHLHDGDLYCGVLDADEYDNAMQDERLDDDDRRVTSMDELTKLLNGSKLDEE
ncbi:hypothetical protein LTR36_000743 [Oleoguttula mirabilis]|uniref:Uncharacterized protein n=1 Tax=Oleoguttula mirabilis TaxID=1507867 RepID=A0AAV9JRY6_9PEZI|nr:hypothetical protein LTR36_000743 [Oleoguttula mirabilis]